MLATLQPRRAARPILATCLLACLPTRGMAEDPPSTVRPLVEERLPDLPRLLVGPVVGVSGGALVVAGGRDPATGEPSAQAFAMAAGDTSWVALSLARPLADVAAATVGDDASGKP